MRPLELELDPVWAFDGILVFVDSEDESCVFAGGISVAATWDMTKDKRCKTMT
jgi:hypothetical protein